MIEARIPPAQQRASVVRGEKGLLTKQGATKPRRAGRGRRGGGSGGQESGRDGELRGASRLLRQAHKKAQGRQSRGLGGCPPSHYQPSTNVGVNQVGKTVRLHGAGKDSRPAQAQGPGPHAANACPTFLGEEAEAQGYSSPRADSTGTVPAPSRDRPDTGNALESDAAVTPQVRRHPGSRPLSEPRVMASSGVDADEAAKAPR